MQQLQLLDVAIWMHDSPASLQQQSSKAPTLQHTSGLGGGAGVALSSALQQDAMAVSSSQQRCWIVCLAMLGYRQADPKKKK